MPAAAMIATPDTIPPDRRKAVLIGLLVMYVLSGRRGGTLPSTGDCGPQLLDRKGRHPF
jgi:hypothetical protein